MEVDLSKELTTPVKREFKTQVEPAVQVLYLSESSVIFTFNISAEISSAHFYLNYEWNFN